MLTVACTCIVLICGVIVWKLVYHLDCCFGEFAFFGSFGLIFGIAPIMQSADSYANEFGLGARTEAAWYSLAGLMMLVAGFALAKRPLAQLAQKKRALLEQVCDPRTQRLLVKLFWLSIGITLFGQLLMMYTKGISLMDLLHSSRFAHRFNNQGVLSVLSIHLTSFVYAPAFIGVFLNRRYQLLTFAYVLLAGAAFFFVFAKGTRSIPLALIATVLVAASIRFKVSPKRVGYTALTGFVAIVLSIGLFELRQHQDSVSAIEGVNILLSASAYSGMWDRDPLGYSSNLVGAVATFPELHPYLNAATYRRMLVFFLQESRFPDLKPPDSNILFGLVVHGRPEELQVTVPPSILGDVYINFWGWFGLPVLCLHGMLYCWLLQRMQTSLLAFLWIGPLTGRFLVLIHRGEPYEMFCLFIMFFFAMGATYGFCRLLGREAPRRSTAPARRHPYRPANRFATAKKPILQ